MSAPTPAKARLVPHPVDSTLRECCQGIGQHTAGGGTPALISTPHDVVGPGHDVPLPVGFVAATGWLRWDTAGNVARCLVGRREPHVTGVRPSVHVELVAVQYADGHIEHPSLGVKSTHHRMAPGSIYADEARQLAADLLAAADELDALTGDA